jgi:hypothetical protein
MQTEMTFHLVKQSSGLGDVVPILVVNKDIVSEILRVHPFWRLEVSLAGLRV